MTRLKFTLVFLVAALISCTSKPERKVYRYIETASGSPTQMDKEEVLIRAFSDSEAYLEAYEKYSVSRKVNRDMTEALHEAYAAPTGFRLLNEKGLDISISVSFLGKQQKEQEIDAYFQSKENTVKKAIDGAKYAKEAAFYENASVDSARVEVLLKNFRVKKDEFSNNNRKWYQPRSAPVYANANGLYCYFQTENGIPSNLRFRFQYYADDWLFFYRASFSIDGKAYEYIPTDVETDNGEGQIWEWFDEAVTESDKELLNAFANAKVAKVKLTGRQYHDVRTISKAQLVGIKQTLELFRAMGGQF